MSKKARLKRIKRQREQNRRNTVSSGPEPAPAGSTFLTITPGTRAPTIRFDSLVTNSTNLVVGHGHTPLDIRGSVVHTPGTGVTRMEVRNLSIGGVPGCVTCERMREEARRRSTNPEIFDN